MLKYSLAGLLALKASQIEIIQTHNLDHVHDHESTSIDALVEAENVPEHTLEPCLFPETDQFNTPEYLA
jgi:hypothetical protein